LLVESEAALFCFVEKTSLVAVCETVLGVDPSMKPAPQSVSTAEAASGNCCVRGLIKVKAALVQSVQAKLAAPVTSFWKSPVRTLRLRSLKESFPITVSRLFRVSVTQSWLVLSSFKQRTERTVGYASCRICVTVAGTEDDPSESPKSLAHPVVMLLTIEARVSLLHDPIEHIPDTQLLTVLGTLWFVPTKNESSAEGLRHAASGELSRPVKELWQAVERDKD